MTRPTRGDALLLAKRRKAVHEALARYCEEQGRLKERLFLLPEWRVE